LGEQVRKAYALATTEGYVACACSDGIVRIFLEGSLEYSATLPRPAPYGYHGLTDANVGAYLALGHRVTAGMKFPDAVACTYLQQGQKIGKYVNLTQKGQFLSITFQHSRSTNLACIE